jgi:hypothetical protein
MLYRMLIAFFVMQQLLESLSNQKAQPSNQKAQPSTSKESVAVNQIFVTAVHSPCGC